MLPEENIEIRDRGHVIYTIPHPEDVTMVTLNILNAAALEAGWLLSLNVDNNTVNFLDIEVLRAQYLF